MKFALRTFHYLLGNKDFLYSSKLIWPIFAISFFFSCRNTTPLVLDYCEMLQEDQFHASGDAMKQGAAEEGDAKKVYKKNFDQLLEIARRQGFPRVSREDSDSPQDSCTYWAIAATFIHTAKSNPEFFFEKSNVNLMKTEMSKENLNKEFLILACNISFQTVTFCNELQPSVENAIKAWNLSPKIYDKARFTQCD